MDDKVSPPINLLKKPKNRKILVNIIIVILVIAIAGLAIFFAPKLRDKFDIYWLKRKCPAIEVKKEIVRGDSLRPVIEPSQEVTILYNYYNCFDVERDDIVVFPYAGQEDPIIKLAKGMPGDGFRIQKEKVGDRWNIVINDEVLLNSQGTKYNLAPENIQVLYLYQKSNNGTIPPNSYLILGNLPQGTLDSTRFGLIHKNDILGKVIK